MATALFLAAVLLGSAPPPSASVCAAAIGPEARAVAYLRGQYRVLGSREGELYKGSLTLAGTEASEVLDVSGTVAGSPIQGTARYVRCGPDRVRQLEVVFVSGQSLYCVPHHDYDNFNRASCSQGLSDPNGDLEFWHEQFAP